MTKKTENLVRYGAPAIGGGALNLNGLLLGLLLLIGFPGTRGRVCLTA